VPAFELVKPQAILPVLPATSMGAPGSVTPVSLCPGHLSDMRYQMFGTPRWRCMSFATSAPPPAARAPATAKLFEPGVSRSPQGAAPARVVAASAGVRPRTSSPGGIGAAASTLPSSAASCGVDRGAKKASDAGPSSSRTAASDRW
jgi:hypothetical protein